VLRYITNKPKLDVTEAASTRVTATRGGDPNSNVNATLNLPLIPDTLAIRGVIYNDSRAVISTTCGDLHASANG